MFSRFFKFLIVGGLGFFIDAGLTLGLISVGLLPLLARPPAILAAMAFTWLANRKLTFRMQSAKSMAEALRYGTVALLVALLNYLIYYGLTLQDVTPFIAIVIATAMATFISYFGYKHFAFKTSADTPKQILSSTKQ